MRYPQGGGLTSERRAFRERIRVPAAELLALGHDNAAVAKRLRVSPRRNTGQTTRVLHGD